MDKSNLQYQLLQNYKKDSPEYKKLISSLHDLEYIQTDLHNIILSQNVKLKNVNKKNNTIQDNLISSTNELEIADTYYFSYKPIIIGTFTGAIFISPITALLGLKYLALTSSIGGILGGIGGYKLMKN